MKTIPIHLKERSYSVVVGKNHLAGLGIRLKHLHVGRGAVVITTAGIKRLHGAKLARGLKQKGFSVTFFEVPDGEKSKSASMAMRLLEKLAAYDVGRQVFIIAFGGGVIGDLAGYVAAVYKRGIPYIQVPTTFLAQIDSAIGGKVAIDLTVGKNLVGAFYQPKLVWSDVAVLRTLPLRQIRNGLAEAIKYGVIEDRALFKYLEGNVVKLLKGDMSVLEHVVLRCSRIKAGVVERDEKETKSIRTILNFGHTAGHAIEAAGHFRAYQHGEAIALGMRVATHISQQRKLLAERDAVRIRALISKAGLPEKIQKIATRNILSLMQHDKKFIAGRNRFVLALGIGKVRVVENIPMSVIKKAVEAYQAS